MTAIKKTLTTIAATALAMALVSCAESYAPGPTVKGELGVSEARQVVKNTLLSFPGCLTQMNVLGDPVQTTPTAVHLTSASLTVDFASSPPKGPYLLKDIVPSATFVSLNDYTFLTVLSDKQMRHTAIYQAPICLIPGNHAHDPAVHHLFDALLVLKQAASDPTLEKDDDGNFAEAVRSNKARATNAELPEDVRRFEIQAEAAVHDGEFANAADFYAKALKIAPWRAENHFNRALVLAEANDVDLAIIEMKRYLLLAPHAANARAAQDKIYQWERKASASD